VRPLLWRVAHLRCDPLKAALLARGSRVLAGQKAIIQMFASVRTHYPRFADGQVPDDGEELRILPESSSSFMGFGKLNRYGQGLGHKGLADGLKWRDCGVSDS